MIKKYGIIAAIILQALILSWIFVARQTIYAFGQEIALRPALYDPRDPFYGDYVNVNFTISRYTLPPGASYQRSIKASPPKNDVYVVLEQINGEWSIKRISEEKPAEKPFLKAKQTYWGGEEVRLEYGFEKYFIEEGTGRQLESEIRTNDNIRVIIAVDNEGNAVVKRLER